MVFWNGVVPESIANQIGRFIGCEPRWESNLDKRQGWIQIEVDLKAGLLDELDLVYGGFPWVLCIKYYKVSFRCSSCHELGHLMAQCRRPLSHFPPFRKNWKRKVGSNLEIHENVVEKDYLSCKSSRDHSGSKQGGLEGDTLVASFLSLLFL
jgi:hypothetical protein